MSDLIERRAAIDMVRRCYVIGVTPAMLIDRAEAMIALSMLPSAQPEIIRCKDCKHWRQQTNYRGVPLSFGFCESEDMWASLYGETCEVEHIDTDNNHYCGYAERKDDD